MGVLTAWMVAIGLQTTRALKADRAPLPSEFVASGAWFGALALLDGVMAPVGGVIAWGTLFALLIQAGSPSALVNPQVKVAGSVGGQTKQGGKAHG